MNFIAGTSSGVYWGKSGTQAEGLTAGAVHHLSRAGDEVFAGAADGVYRSADGGRTWKLTGIDGADVWNIAAAPEDPRTLYAGTQPAHFFKSSDAGKTWQPFDSFLQVDGADKFCLPGGQTPRALTFVVNPFKHDNFLAGVEVGGVLTSDDAGGHWSLGLLRDNADVHVLMAHPSKPNVVYATSGHGRNDDLPMDPRMAGLYRSQDGGKSWDYLARNHGPHCPGGSLHDHGPGRSTGRPLSQR
jgi:photosystem II stability/assembly factor-like uncharacterized protein